MDKYKSKDSKAVRITLQAESEMEKMNVVKNDVVITEIEDMSENGEGIGKVDGYTLFVKDAIVGDRAEVKVVKAKKSYGYARLVKLLSPSSDRVEPVCPAAAPCGGCQLQAMSYEAQLQFKENKVKNHLERIGGFADAQVLPVIGMEKPFHYRNKAQFPVTRDKEGHIRMGFYAGRTHSVIETPHCYIGHPVNDEILALVKRYMEREQIPPYDETRHSGLVRHVLIRRAAATGQIMVCLVINGKKLPAADRLVRLLLEVEGMAVVGFNVNTERTNVILGEKTVILHGPGYITDRIGELSFRISPQSFFQVNPVQTEKLYEKVLEFAGLKGEETVWDLYCGIGTISLFLAGKAKRVYGVEIVPQAIENARENAKLNKIGNAEFFVGKAEEVLPEWYERQNGKDENDRSVLNEGENDRPVPNKGETDGHVSNEGETDRKADVRKDVRTCADVIVVDPPRKGCAQSLLDTIIRMRPERLVYVSCNSATLARDLRYLCQEGFVLEKVQPVDMFAMTVGVECVVLLSHKSSDRVIHVTVEFGEGEGKARPDSAVEHAKN